MYKMSLNEILTLIFAKTLQKELVKGPYLEYVNIEENSKAARESASISNELSDQARTLNQLIGQFRIS